MIRGWTRAFLIIACWVALRLAVWGGAKLPDLAGAGPWGILVLDLAMTAVLLRTALRFSPGDPPRVAWGLAFTTHALATVAHALDSFAWAPTGGIEHALIVVLNGTWIACILVFVVNVRHSGLIPPWTPVQIGVVGLASAIASAIAFWILGDLLAEPITAGATWTDTYAPLTSNIASTVGDAGVFVAALFLIRLVLPMAGGALVRPYLLFALSSAAFLVLDALLAAAGESMYSGLDSTSQVIVAMAGGGLIAAAMAQVEMLDC